MKQQKGLFLMSIIISLTGDFFYFGSLLFRSFMIDINNVLATDSVNLSSAGENNVLFLTSILGAMLYLIAFLLIALSIPDQNKQRNWILAGLIVWFITDSIASIIFNFYYNIVLNFGFLVIGIFLIYLLNEDR